MAEDSVVRKSRQLDFLDWFWKVVKGVIAIIAIGLLIADRMDESIPLTESERARREQLISLEITEKAQNIAAQAEIALQISNIKQQDIAQTALMEELQDTQTALNLRISLKDQRQDDEIEDAHEDIQRNETILRNHQNTNHN